MTTTNVRGKKTKEQKPVQHRDGLDDELAFFINSLLDQNAELSGKLQNVDSLMGLAEKTVIEAGKEAEDLKIEAEAKAASIIAKAREEAQAEAQKIINDANDKTEAEARRIIAEGKRIISEAEKKAEDTLQEKLSSAEQQARDIVKAAEEKVALIVEEAQKKAEEEAQLIKKDAEQLLASVQKTEEHQAIRKPRDVPDEVPDQPEDSPGIKPVSMAEKKPPESPISDAAVSTTPPATGEKPLEQPLHVQAEEEESEKESPLSPGDTAELEIQPPIRLYRMLQLYGHLKKDSRIKIVNLKVLPNKSLRIKLLVQANTPLPSILTALPEIAKAADGIVEAGNVSPDHGNGNGARSRTITVSMKK